MEKTIFEMTVRFPYSYDEEEETKWIKTFHIESSTSLYKLLLFLLDSIDFDLDHTYDFFLRKNHRGYDGEISEDLTLEQIYPTDKKKLFLLYDYGDNWLFEFRKSEKKVMFDKNVKYPKVIKTQGKNPIQYQ